MDLAEPPSLSNAALPKVRKAVVPLGYDRAKVRTGVVHIGVGNFHRAHQAVFTNAVLRTDPQWGVFGIGMLAFDQPMADKLRAQDYLYAVWERSPAGADALRVVG